jgi:serine/threonine protein kinase
MAFDSQATVHPRTTSQPGRSVSYGVEINRTEVAEQYRILGEVAVGGMGLIYRVHDVCLNDGPFALKMVSPDRIGDEIARSLFLREMKAGLDVMQSGASFENLVIYTDRGFWDTAGGHRVPYYVMEYMEGGSLKTLLRDCLDRKVRLEIDTAFDIAIQVLRGLYQLHKAGIAHLDMKPGNILLRRRKAEGDHETYHAKISDYGTGLNLHREGASSSSSSVTAHTKDYAAPEQSRGGQPDRRSDLFSFGIVLYELFAGEPFDINTANRESLGRRHPALKALDGIINTCCSASADRRIPKSIRSGGEFSGQSRLSRDLRLRQRPHLRGADTGEADHSDWTRALLEEVESCFEDYKDADPESSGPADELDPRRLRKEIGGLLAKLAVRLEEKSLYTNIKPLRDEIESKCESLRGIDSEDDSSETREILGDWEELRPQASSYLKQGLLTAYESMLRDGDWGALDRWIGEARPARRAMRRPPRRQDPDQGEFTAAEWAALVARACVAESAAHLTLGDHPQAEAALDRWIMDVTLDASFVQVLQSAVEQDLNAMESQEGSGEPWELTSSAIEQLALGSELRAGLFGEDRVGDLVTRLNRSLSREKRRLRNQTRPGQETSMSPGTPSEDQGAIDPKTLSIHWVSEWWESVRPSHETRRQLLDAIKAAARASGGAGAELQTKLAALESECSRRSQMVAGLQSKLKESEQAARAMRAKSEDLQSQLEAAEKGVSSASDHAGKELSTKLAAAEAECARRSELAVGLQSKLQQANQSVLALNAEVKNLQSQISAASKASLAAEKGEMAKRETAVAAQLNSRIADLEAQLGKTKAEHAGCPGKLNAANDIARQWEKYSKDSLAAEAAKTAAAESARRELVNELPGMYCRHCRKQGPIVL